MTTPSTYRSRHTIPEYRLHNIVLQTRSLVVVGKIAKVKGIVKLVSQAAGPIKELRGAYKKYRKADLISRVLLLWLILAL